VPPPEECICRFRFHLMPNIEIDFTCANTPTIIFFQYLN
jgi:hypothetical protein